MLPIGFACAPQIWMDYVTLILNYLDQKSRYIAIIDDLLIHSSKQVHWELLKDLLKAMIKMGSGQPKEMSTILPYSDLYEQQFCPKR